MELASVCTTRACTTSADISKGAEADAAADPAADHRNKMPPKGYQPLMGGSTRQTG